MSTPVRRWNRGMSRCSPAIVLSDLGVGTILWASYLFRWRSLTVSSSNPEVPAREVDEAGRRSGSRASPFPTGAQSEDETDENRKEQECAHVLHTMPPAGRAQDCASAGIFSGLRPGS